MITLLISWFEAMKLFDTQDSPFPPKVHGSGRIWGKKALTVCILKQFPTVCSRVWGGWSPLCLDAPVTDRRKLWFSPPHPLSLLESLPKIKSNVSSALSKCLPSFDLANRPPYPPSSPPILCISGGGEIRVSIIMFLPFKVRHLKVESLSQSSWKRWWPNAIQRLSLETGCKAAGAGLGSFPRPNGFSGPRNGPRLPARYPRTRPLQWPPWLLKTGTRARVHKPTHTARDKNSLS